MSYTTCTLSNGLVVANFSSPHEFKFEDGTILPACSAGRAKRLMLVAEESESTMTVNGCTIVDLELTFKMSQVVEQELSEMCLDDSIDIVLVPLPVLQCARELKVGWIERKARAIRVKDRVTKEIHIDRFCK